MISQITEFEDVSERHSPSEHLKDEFRKKLARDVEAFVSNGGTVETIAIGVIAQEESSEWTRGMKCGDGGNGL